MVGPVGVEPTVVQVLSPLRLPIPPRTEAPYFGRGVRQPLC